MAIAPNAASRRGWLVPFVLLAFIWGASFLFIKVAIGDMPPIDVAFYRLAIGGLTLLTMVAVTGAALPRQPRLYGHLFVIALFNHAIPFALFAYGEQYVSSVVAGIWNATTPLATVLVALAMLPDERPTPSKLVGLGIGFAGVLTVLGVWAGIGGSDLRGHLMCAIGAACYGIAIPYTRRFVAGRAIAGTSLAAVQISLGAFQVLAATIVLNGSLSSPSAWSPATMLSMLALGALGSGVAFSFTYRIIRLAGATTASTITYVIPVVATTLGVVILHETLAWNQPVGAAVVLIGVAVSQSRWRHRAQPALATESALAEESV